MTRDEDDENRFEAVSDHEIDYQRHEVERARRRERNRSSWESGKPDYLGMNAFDRIRRHLDETLGLDELSEPEPEPLLSAAASSSTI